MDIVFPQTNNQAWFATMANLEARKLIETVNIVSTYHLKDGLTRIHYLEEIRKFITQQFSAIASATSDDAKMACITNLQTENADLFKQHNMLTSGAARLYAKINFIKEHNKIVGYVISAAQVIGAGIQIYGGTLLIASMTPLGMLLGATLITDGINTVTREVNHQILNRTNSEGVVADGVIATAKFMGFSKNTGLATYDGITLAANAYSVFGFLRKKGSWRLFRYLSTDFYRTANSMSKPKLTMKIVGYGLQAKVIFELIKVSNAQQN